MKPMLPISVIQHDIEASGHSYYQLLELLVAVAGARGPARDVVQIVNSLDFERHVTGSFDEREITTRIMDLRKIDKFTVLNTRLDAYEEGLELLNCCLLLGFFARVCHFISSRAMVL